MNDFKEGQRKINSNQHMKRTRENDSKRTKRYHLEDVWPISVTVIPHASKKRVEPLTGFHNKQRIGYLHYNK